jgi:hypothetical protein
MRWACHIRLMGKMRNAYKIVVEKPEGKIPLGDLGTDGRTMLEWILEEKSGKLWSGFI